MIVVSKRSLLFMCFFLLCSSDIWTLERTAHPDYLRTLNRSASVGTADAMFFNPAGLVYLVDGSYLQLGLDLPVFIKDINFQNTSSGSNGKFNRSITGVNLAAMSFGYAHKKDNSTIYFTVKPLVSSLFSLNNVLMYTEENSRVDYKHYDVGYEATLGYAMQLHEMVALSIGGRLLTEFHSANDTYYAWGLHATSLTEQYRYNGFLIGAALQAGLLVTLLPWLAVSLNLHSGSILMGNSTVSHQGPIPWPSDQFKRPQGGLMTQSDPARMDLGLLFNIDDIAKVQVTGQVKINLLRNERGKVHFDEVDPAVTWSMGTGADFNLPGNIILGLGVLYSNDLPRMPDNHYELFRAIELGQMQNIAFGVGLSVPLGSVVELSLSGMMPIYFDTGVLTSRQLQWEPAKLYNFVAYDFIFGLGMMVKMGKSV